MYLFLLTILRKKALIRVQDVLEDARKIFTYLQLVGFTNSKELSSVQIRVDHLTPWALLLTYLNFIRRFQSMKP